MKRIILTGICCVLIAGCSPSRMVAKMPCPDLREIKPPVGKAALVVGRTTVFGSAINIDNFVDRKFTGTTRGRGFFVTNVEPGEHYAIADAENFDTVFLNFEPDKTYWLHQGIKMGIMSARTAYEWMDAKKMYDEMGGNCQYYELNPNEKVADLEESTFNKLVKEYKENHAENAKK